MRGSQNREENGTGARLVARFGWLLALAVLLLSACSEMAQAPEAPEGAPTIAETVENHDDLGIFAQVIAAARMNGMLDSEGPFTVFAPSAQAFGAYLKEKGLTIGELLDDPELVELLAYSVLEGSFPAAELVAEERRPTLEGTTLRIDAVDGGVKLNARVNVTDADIEASNGIIHVIDTVLEPPATIVEIAAATPELSTLVAAVTEAGLIDALGQDGLTVFAPTDDAFAALLAELHLTPEELLASPELTAILTYHVLGEEESSFELLERTSVVTLNGAEIAIEVDEDGLLLNGSVRVEIADVVASNGIVHVIDAVLLPAAPSIVEIVTTDPRFSILAAALTEAELVAALEGDGPFTVFAPTDDAFEDLARLYNLPVEDLLVLPFLTDVLLYHVAPGAFGAAELIELHQVETLLEDATVSIKPAGDSVILNGGTRVIEADIGAANGIVHVIDGVLLPH